MTRKHPARKTARRKQPVRRPLPRLPDPDPPAQEAEPSLALVRRDGRFHPEEYEEDELSGR